jgi:predicted metal-dependent enzyme (double-stranded beta helix superfamily)
VVQRAVRETRPDLSNILRDLIRDHGTAFQGRATFQEGADYHRQRVHAAPDLEVWLLSWLPGQVTPIHDHGGAVTVTTVLSGAVLEERFERVGRVDDDRVLPTRTTVRGPCDIDPIDPAAIHRVRPLGRVVTLHLYVPACIDGRIFREA